MLLDNQYVFQPYWDWQNGRISEAEYQRQFDGSSRIRHHLHLGHTRKGQRADTLGA